MTLLASALTALLLLGGPAAAGSVATDLPHLIWPQDGTPTVTRSCGTPATTAPTCAISE